MMKKRFDSCQIKKALQKNIANFKKREETLEDYALGKLIEENNPSERMSLSEAKIAYSQLKNSNSSESSDS